ncbi:MAG: hypothetical protein ABJQ34_00970 [Paracoccaceae bacterium]|uniref:hypothetical protein n=1 Tax=Pseudophaeobacter sp. TaxID=1971739 RepID=UPI003297E5B3
MADPDINIGRLPRIQPTDPTDILGSNNNLVSWAAYNVNISGHQAGRLSVFADASVNVNLADVVSAIYTENNNWNYSPIAQTYATKHGFTFSFSDNLNETNDLDGDGVADFVDIDLNFDGIVDQRVYSGQYLRSLTEGLLSNQNSETGPECFGPDTPIDMWPLDPQFAHDPNDPNKVFDQDAVRAKIWKKPIAMIRKGDTVVSFDKHDNLVPGTVTRTFENESKILLDYFGTRVTPGHVYFRPDSKKTDKFECLLDILRDDGMIQNVEGKNIRAAINVPVGDLRDGFVWAITQERKDGILVEKEHGRIRLGSRFIVDGNTSQCVADVIEAKGGVVGDDELIRYDGAAPKPFVWEHGATLPKPEDFVLQTSGTTVEEIYCAGEWESRRPHMPAPMVMDGGPVQPLSATALLATPRNQPLNLQPASAPKHAMRPPMNRKQRKALEAKQRKTTKTRRRLVS